MLVGVEQRARARGGLIERVAAPRQEIVSDSRGRVGELEGIENIPVPHPRFPSVPPQDTHGVPVNGIEIGRLGDAEGIPEQNYQHSDGRVLGHLAPSVVPSVGIAHIAVGF